jgi:hypothetical protein
MNYNNEMNSIVKGPLRWSQGGMVGMALGKPTTPRTLHTIVAHDNCYLVGTHQINTLWVSQQNKQKTTTIAF